MCKIKLERKNLSRFLPICFDCKTDIRRARTFFYYLHKGAVTKDLSKKQYYTKLLNKYYKKLKIHKHVK
jgi:hypothetical protein